MKQTQLLWLRQDLRISDNPALAAAAERGKVLPVFILDDTPAVRAPGGAARWWLHHSLTALRETLGSLLLLRGNPANILQDLARRVNADGVWWNRCYEPYAIARDRQIKGALRAAGLAANSCNSALLFEPWEIKSAAGRPYGVFTPF